MAKIVDATPSEKVTSRLPELPGDWPMRRLGDVFDITQGKALNRKSKGSIRRPFLRTANVFWNRLELAKLDEMEFTPEEEARLRLQPGDLLTCEGGDIGRTSIWNDEVPGCLYQNHIHRLRRKDPNTDPRFFMFWMQAAFTLWGQMEGKGNNSTIPNLSKQRLAAFDVPYPPPPEQRLLAESLATIFGLRQRIEQELRAVDKVVVSALAELMSGQTRI